MKIEEYRSVKLEIFQHEESLAWFYCFGFNWVIYRSNQGYRTLEEASDAGRAHIDRVLKEHTVEI